MTIFPRKRLRVEWSIIYGGFWLRRPKARGYSWSPGEFGRPKCWYRDVADADRAAEVSWLRANVMGPDQAVWALRITARDRYSDRCWGWGESLGMPLECAADRVGRG